MDDLQIGLLVLVEVEAFGADEDGVDLSLGIKVWDTLFYLPRESDAGASWFCSVTIWSLGLGFWSLEIWCLLKIA